MNKKLIKVLSISMAIPTLVGCGTKGNESGNNIVLDPNNPVSLSIWHYYNGKQQQAFDTLTSEFNATLGKEKGIYIEGLSLGTVNDLEKAITDSMNGAIGAKKLPDIFSTYPDTAYSAQQKDQLIDLTNYFSKDELSTYVDSYIEEGYFKDDGALYLFPIAKSTEIMLLNKTDWQPFAQAYNVTYNNLSTIEGVVEVAKKYYEYTDALTPDIANDGKAFYGRDSMSNYFIISMKQMGINIFDVNKGEVTIKANKEEIRRLWDNYYVPYVSGYFGAYSKFRSDDVKTGDILAYTGSSSSAMYFPNKVILDDKTYEIDYEFLPIPIMSGGNMVNVQQGAGVAVTKSDKKREYAACEFIKWFTSKENNLRFVSESSYLPVKKEANTIQAVDEIIEKENLKVDNITHDCLEKIMNSFDTMNLYTTKNFTNGYNTRKVLDYSLSDKATADKKAIDAAISAGKNREEVLQEYITDENFDTWYENFVDLLNETAKQK